MKLVPLVVEGVIVEVAQTHDGWFRATCESDPEICAVGRTRPEAVEAVAGAIRLRREMARLE